MSLLLLLLYLQYCIPKDKFKFFAAEKKECCSKKLALWIGQHMIGVSVTRFSTFVLFISSIYSTEQYELSFKIENFDSTVKSDCYA